MKSVVQQLSYKGMDPHSYDDLFFNGVVSYAKIGTDINRLFLKTTIQLAFSSASKKGIRSKFCHQSVLWTTVICFTILRYDISILEATALTALALALIE
mmetsp:Transcript_3357/g.4902  ORF Transcript_3357/g.4902 Transcript_3357/m.4902 type:complete len:99 (-) Transcript_3357:85-381(-)